MRWAGNVECIGKRDGGCWVAVGKPEEKDSLENPGLVKRLILKYILRKQHKGVEWINLAQDRDRWQAFLDVVMNLRVA